MSADNSFGTALMSTALGAWCKELYSKGAFDDCLDGKKCDNPSYKPCCVDNSYCAFYNQAWFMWVCIGGGVLIIVLIVLICCCICKKRGGGG
ncbi:unnamed protein product [Caenorhabditis sp. 36 PRJEB53466]|nr:unnamed protein product [Caenorhabditis sp. 36 PRJEB53466]